MKYLEKNDFISPHIFQHIDLLKNFDESEAIEQGKLINIINYHHFSGNPLHILLKHPVFQNYLRIPAYSEPCLGSQLKCRWSDSYFQYQLQAFHPICLLIAYHSKIIVVPYDQFESDFTTFTTRLPKKSYALNEREYPRYASKNILAELIQGDLRITGKLVDFSASAFRIQSDSDSSLHNSWFNHEVPVSIRLFSGDKIIYANSCRCLRYKDDVNLSKEIVFASENQHFSRFPAKKIRNPRHQIMPPPTALFDHPLIDKKIQRDIFDMSSSGFSIFDKPLDDIFFPGMVIPHLSIQIAGISIADCVAQIIYRRIENQCIKYGFAILDMDIHSYSRICHLLSIDSDPGLSVSTEVDMDALWEFFFQSGFIYPEKYGSCHPYKKHFFDTYRKLYEENPTIARHIVYKKNGHIYAHISMIRAYERAWLLQHHAAKIIECHHAGFAVLRQMMLFTHGMYQLPSAFMDYVFSYFRPDNKFPNRVFGGFARYFNDPQACSMDLFTYLTIPNTRSVRSLPPGWLLRESTANDLWELELFYMHHSGGLFLKILNSMGSCFYGGSIENVFEKNGFLRKCRIYSLCHKDKLKAVFIVDQSDFSINLSNLLNCIKAILIDSTGLSSDLFFNVVTTLGSVYNLDKITLLLYPASSDKSECFPHSKQYLLWIGDMRYMNQFMDYVQSNFRMKYK